MATKKDLTGQKFGKWTALSREKKDHHTYWLCRCECGLERNVLQDSLTSGKSTKCGSCFRAFNDLSGQRFGSWLVLRRSEKITRSRPVYFWCQCDCGTLKEVSGREMKEGKSKSCGCRVMLEDGGAARNSVWATSRASARKRKIEWALDRDFFRGLVEKDCYYCGLPPSQYRKTSSKKTLGILTSGIDRIDSSMGYLVVNVVPCCKHCNFAKAERTQEQFYAWVERIHTHSVSRGIIKSKEETWIETNSSATGSPGPYSTWVF